MSNTIHFTQPYEDQEIPVEITWEISYEVVHDELLLTGYEVLEVRTYFDGVGYRAQLTTDDSDGSERVKMLHLGKLKRIYDESIREKCLEHYETYGRDLDDEGRRVA